MNSERKAPDQAERDKIVEHLDTTMLVEAAAGTGKTTALANRMIALLMAGKGNGDTLAAVTFTRKAAAELQSKFAEKLQQAGLARDDRGFIGTIHSFCAHLLRERPVEAGVDPDFMELEEEQDERLRRQAWENCVARLFATDDPLLDTLDDLGLVIADLRLAFEEFAEYPDVEDWPAPVVPPPPLEPVVTALENYMAHVQRLGLPPDGTTDELIALLRRLPLLAAARDLTRPAEVAEIFEQCRAERKCTQKNWPGQKEQALHEHVRWDKFVAEVARPFLDAWRAYRYPVVLQLLQKARVEYDTLRRGVRALNFQDLLMLAARLLRDRPEIRQYFRCRFTHVLVDEFQDTDPVQAEVMLLLTADDPRERDWRKCRPIPGSLFVVGDPKQSIYRFRRADIVTYNAVKRIIGAAGEIVHLTANFRSVKPLVDWVNETFKAGFFPKTADEFSPGYEEILVGHPELKAPSPFVLKLLVDGNKDDIATAEAELLARHVHQHGKPGDFLIVTRRKERLSVYASALEALGIPHEVTGGSALNEVRELTLWHTLLRAVIEPHNPVALVAALRSELFGFSDQTLYAFKRAEGRFDYRVPPTDKAFAEVFEKLELYARWLAELPPMVALERVLADMGLPALAAARGELRAGSLGKAVELLRAAQAELPTVTELVQYLGDLVERSEQHDGVSALGQRSPAVRLMNLHKVKGLEAPVVFLADPSGVSEHPVRLHIDRSSVTARGYLALYGDSEFPRNAPLLAHPPGWARWAEREQRFHEAEENRLLYVAATRAATRLVVSVRSNRIHENPWQPLAGHLTDAPELPDLGPQQPPGVETETVTQADVAAALAQIRARWQTVLAPTYSARAAKQISFPCAPLATRDEASGMRWGGVIHALLQAAMSAPKTDWDALATALLQAADLDVTLVEEAVETVRHVMESTLWQRASSSRQRSTELPFVVLDAGDGALVRGVIDLAFEESDGWVIVDYKTDRATGQQLEKLAETYRPQVAVYRTAWAQILQQPVKEVGLYFTHANRYVTVTP